MAFVKLDPEDIQRENLGGPLKDNLIDKAFDPKYQPEDDSSGTPDELPNSCKPSFIDDLEKTK